MQAGGSEVQNHAKLCIVEHTFNVSTLEAEEEDDFEFEVRLTIYIESSKVSVSLGCLICPCPKQNKTDKTRYQNYEEKRSSEGNTVGIGRILEPAPRVVQK